MSSTRSYFDPSEPVTNGRNNDIKASDHGRRFSELTLYTVLVHGRWCVCVSVCGVVWVAVGKLIFNESFGTKEALRIQNGLSCS